VRLIPLLVLIAACTAVDRPTGARGDGRISAAEALAGTDAPQLPPDQANAILGFQFQSELPVDAAGLALSESGSVAHAGLGQVACDVLPHSAVIAADYYDPGDDTVSDGGWFNGAEVFVTFTPGRVNIHPVGSGSTSDSFGVDAVTDARLTDDGFVAMSRSFTGCMIGWYDSQGALDDATVFGSQGASCDGSLAVDRATGTVWVGSPEGVLEIDPAGITLVDSTPSAQVAFEGGLYIGGADGLLRSLAVDGSAGWVSQLDGPIEALAVDPTQGVLFAAVDSFERRLIAIDSADAIVLGGISYSASAQGIALSGSGYRLALDTSSGVEFYNLIQN